MAQAAINMTEDVPPPQWGGAIDRDHLARMTFGDLNLERELLELFDQQASVLLARMRTADAPAVATLAHTLRGSALGVGAFEVAEAAAAVEQTDGPVAMTPAINRLAAEVERARAHIAHMLRTVLDEARRAREG